MEEAVVDKNKMVFHKRKQVEITCSYVTPKKKPVNKITRKERRRKLPYNPITAGRKLATIKTDLGFVSSLTLKEKKAFGLFLKIKEKYYDGRLYAYTPFSASQKLNLSVYQIKKYIPLMIEKGWAYLSTDGDLATNSMRKICGVEKLRLKITLTDKLSLNKIVGLLNFSILREAIKCQEYIRGQKRNESMKTGELPIKRYSDKDYKAFRKTISFEPNKLMSGALVDFNVMGMRKLSRLLRCSVGKSWKMIVELSLAKKIKSRNCLVLYAKGGDKNFNGDEYKRSVGKKAGYLYYFNGNIYLHLGTMITLL